MDALFDWILIALGVVVIVLAVGVIVAMAG